MMKAEYETRVSDYYYRNDCDQKIRLGCGPHLHYHVELLYMERGSVTAYVDSEAYEVCGGDFLAVFPNKIHRFENTSDAQRYHLFIISPDMAESLASKFRNYTPYCPLIKKAGENKRLLSLIYCLSRFDNVHGTYREIILGGYLTAFFGEILSMLSLDGAKAEDNHAMKTVVDYCSRNFTKDLSLSVLEEELHMSKFYISHIFSDKLGIRFNDYINSLRVSEACRHLRTGDLSITQISVMSGFGTLRTFNRAFIKQTGVSPSDYRKSIRADTHAVSIPS